ncbi:SDR family oxidoreductase [Azospirillum argentinense]
MDTFTSPLSEPVVASSAYGHAEGGYIDAFIDLVADVTRYPRDILDADADLENDLGIDSVKRGEIFLAARRRFQLADELEVPAEAFRTIRSAAAALTGRNRPVVALSEGRDRPVEPVLAANANASADLLNQLTELVAEVTRYPADILLPDADFENDLGIDSVKRGEILVAVRRRFGLAEDFQADPSDFRTLEAVARMLSSVVAPIAALAPDTPPAGAIPVAEPTVLSRLKDIVARVTRYPEELLEPHADFEDDLGIDSVKRGEILLAVRDEFQLSTQVALNPEGFRTLEAAARILEELPVPKNGVTGLRHGTAPATAQAVPAAAAAPVEPVRPNHRRELTDIFADNGGRPFAGKVALVTGSGRGIGKDIACSLARLGATVIVNAFHSREEGEQTTAEIVQAGGSAHFLWGSVANPQHRKALFDAIEDLGGVDFFISNASNGLIGPFDRIDDAAWAKGFQTNLVGLHQCALRAAPMMARRGGGKIITLSTPVSHRHVADFACMAALKASVESLTRSMAVEFAAHNVSVNCVSAGAVYGDLIKKFPESDKAISYWTQKSLGNRLVYTQEICNFINFLLSGAADAINGSILVIDGGITIRL